MSLRNAPLRPLFAACVAGALASACAFSALAGEVSQVEVSTGATGTRAEIQLQGKGEFKTLSLHGPERLVVDLPASSAARGLKMPAASGIVTAVRTGQPSPGTLRIVFDLAAPITALKPRVEAQASGARLVIEWPGDAPAGSTASRTPATASPSSESASTSATQARAPASANTATASPAATNAPATASVDPAEAARATAALTNRVVSQAAQPTAQPAASPTAAPANASGATALAILNGQATSAAAPAAVATAPGSTGVTPAGVPYTVATGKPAASESTEPAPATTPRVAMQSGMRPLIVAIDPGHGGQDSGAIGQDGTYEKNVVLAIARELAKQINATPGMKAYLTRDSDVFIPLPQRARRARSANADIFVSIHADAAENRGARGSSVYVLSLKGASSQRARWLADKENASDLIGGVPLQKVDNTLSSVLLDLAQSGHMRASEDAANHVLDGLKRVGNNHKPNIERANFAVLRTSDMPAMLVETAFISNPEEERRLKDPAYQRKVAAAVLDGVNTYFTRQPPPGTLFAARARAEAEARDLAANGGAAP
ncbi:N-acetylmuramoyl-L-alanine amidase [Pseudoxanthomonas indica]|uniref:N-acetylmuramoyl-L-alanine amidase AmiC n=1 Tax=Pseudoxanthomonas indica TaxID=428993 RepID=A0A1T5J0M1_9GAMM|nr:N-acetylmuramoyl-L-alanine amidase [Pseudoxanthomonas indica]GGD55547.1 N-acetylmuramoyl-L-alanine amidase [Pseudoxanthomonas indica]SKC45009.1 N-acetylmuramoyl-L-alanine amidase [Pseudoxanthomonas indica]